MNSNNTLLTTNIIINNIGNMEHKKIELYELWGVSDSRFLLYKIILYYTEGDQILKKKRST